MRTRAWPPSPVASPTILGTISGTGAGRTPSRPGVLAGLALFGAVLALGSCSAARTTEPGVEPMASLDLSAADLALRPCQGLGCFVANCPADSETIVIGKVTAPNGTDPIRDALVYVPSGGAPEEFPPQVACEVCQSPLGERPIALTSTDVDGTFELRRVPVTAETPIVIQKGRWRKVVHLPIGKCEKQGLTPEQGRLPKDRTEGTIPRMAVAVGEWDSIECVLGHIGLAKSEFTSPLGSGAVHLYENEKPGGVGAPGGVAVSELLTSLPKMLAYNLIFLNCSDDEQSRGLLADPGVKKNLTEYVARGGRLYLTDWSYDFVQQPPEFAPFICFNDDKPCTVTTPHGFHEATSGFRTGSETVFYADVDQTTPGGRALAAWLTKLPKPITGGKVRIEDPVATFVLIQQLAQDPVKYPATAWLSADLKMKRRPVSVSFDYPPGPGACGRVLFSSYHTRGHDNHAVQFPAYCATGAALPQEQVLEYLIFELGACVQPPG